MDRRLAAAMGVLVIAAGVGLVAVVPAGAQETGDCSFPISVTDATGTEVSIPEEPDRLVALAPSAAQQLWAIEAQDRVVGMPINEYTAYLEDREGAENVVGDDGQPVQETVVGLEPDLVLAPNVIDNRTVASLRSAGLTVYRFEDARSLADVADEIELTGRLVGDCESAAAVATDVRETVADVRDAVAGEDRPRVYYALGDGWTAGNETFIGDLIATAGGDNIATAAGIERYDTISGEVVADSDPEVLVVHEGAAVPDTPAVRNSTAVREGAIVRVNANFINQPGPRNLVPLDQLAEAFHPDAMGVEAETPADGTTRTPTETTGNATEGADGSGFTVVSAAIALAAVGFVSRRH